MGLKFHFCRTRYRNDPSAPSGEHGYC